jgi:hypothetical protein
VFEALGSCATTFVASLTTATRINVTTIVLLCILINALAEATILDPGFLLTLLFWIFFKLWQRGIHHLFRFLQPFF